MILRGFYMGIVSSEHHRVPFLMQEANIVDRGPGKMLFADMESIGS